MAEEQQYINLNVCKSFNQVLTTNLVALSSQICSEVIIYNKTGADILLYDSNNFNALNAFLISNNDSFVVRGITNTNQVSAVALSAGTIYYRSQFYSNNPSR